MMIQDFNGRSKCVRGQPADFDPADMSVRRDGGLVP